MSSNVLIAVGSAVGFMILICILFLIAFVALLKSFPNFFRHVFKSEESDRFDGEGDEQV